MPQVKPLCGMPTPHINMPVRILAALFLIQLHAHVPGEAAYGGPNTWVPAIYVGDPAGVAGSCLHPYPVLIVDGIWRLNQQMEDPCVCVCVPFCHCAHPVLKKSSHQQQACIVDHGSMGPRPTSSLLAPWSARVPSLPPLLFLHPLSLPITCAALPFALCVGRHYVIILTTFLHRGCTAWLDCLGNPKATLCSLHFR